MRSRIFVVTLFLVFSLSLGIAQGNSGQPETLILFLGGVEAGREDYWSSEESLKTQGAISVGVQSLSITSAVTVRAGSVTKYEAALKPGASFSAGFKAGTMDVLVGPIKRSFAFQEPYVVLDNNVFAHYKQLFGLIPTGEEQISLDVIVPSLVLANQNPVHKAELRSMGGVYYQIGDQDPMLLQELILSMAGNLQIRVLGDAQGRLISFEIPMQGVQVVRDGYVGLGLVEDQRAQANQFVRQDFVVQNGSIHLAGTLALPLGEGPFPAVLLNSGSGPQDRNGNTPPAFMTNMFSIMTKKLTEAGFAVLCYDERGVGESTGNYDAATLKDLLSDVAVLLEFLGTHPEIDQDRIAMLGHSEGAYFAPMFADKLSAMVLLAGSSISLDKIMEEQLAYQEAQPWLSPQEKAILQDYRPKLQTLLSEAREGREESQVLPLNLNWLREHMDLDPLENVSKVTSPVLIVQGERDLKVMPYHAERLAETLKTAGNEQIMVRFLVGTTHEFTFFPLDNPDFDSLDPLRLNPDLFEIVVDWLKNHL